MKHSQGTWSSETGLGLDVISIDADGNRTFIANCGNYQGDNEFTEQKRANARLIAAAPELLEALENLILSISCGDLDNEYGYHHLDVAKAIINKATQG